MAKRFTVIVEWTDSQDEKWFDADEVVVVAESAAQAIAKAKGKWRQTVGSRWPRCVMDKAWVLTPSRRLGLV